jgi:hypothetical protein
MSKVPHATPTKDSAIVILNGVKNPEGFVNSIENKIEICEQSQ